MKILLTALFINLFICAKDDNGVLCYDAQSRMIEANGKGTLRIFDILGHEIYRCNLQDTEGVLYDMNSKNKGLYIAKIRNKTIKFTKH